jgi:hypothetical protein
VLLAVLGAVLGVRTLVAMSPPGLPLLNAISVNWSVLLFAAGLTATVGIAFRLAPALQAERSNLQQEMRHEGYEWSTGNSRRHAGFRRGTPRASTLYQCRVRSRAPLARLAASAGSCYARQS